MLILVSWGLSRMLQIGLTLSGLNQKQIGVERTESGVLVQRGHEVGKDSRSHWRGRGRRGGSCVVESGGKGVAVEVVGLTGWRQSQQ